MFNRKAKQQLEAVQNVARRAGRGIHKRIDENREMLELLQERAPDLLRDHPWIEGWISSHDYFFSELEKVIGIEKTMAPLFTSYPRPWPGKARLTSGS